VGDEHGVTAEIMEGGQNDVDLRLPAHHVVGDAVNAHTLGSQEALRVDQLIKVLVPQKAAVDDAHGTDLDDLVPGSGLEPGGFGVEDGVRQIAQPPVEIDALVAEMKEVEIVVLRADARLVAGSLRLQAVGQGDRQDEAKEAALAGLFAFVPDFTTMAVDHIAQRQG
jgi:hypothetical protein